MSDKLPPEDEMSDWTTEFWSDPPAAPDPVGSEKAAADERQRLVVQVLDNAVVFMFYEGEWWRDANDSQDTYLGTWDEHVARALLDRIERLEGENDDERIDYVEWRKDMLKEREQLRAQLKAAREELALLHRDRAKGLTTDERNRLKLLVRDRDAALAEIGCPGCREGKAHSHTFEQDGVDMTALAEMGDDDGTNG